MLTGSDQAEEHRLRTTDHGLEVLRTLAAACSTGLPAWRGAEPRRDTYTVQPGDTLSENAAVCGKPLDELVSQNGASYLSLRDDPGLIRAGWEIAIPTRGLKGAAEKNPADPASISASVSASTPSVAAAEELRLVDREIVRLTNEAMRSEGLHELEVEELLMLSARERASEPPGDYSHDGLADACSRQGLTGKARAENVGRRSARLPQDMPAVEFVLRVWLVGAGHWPNLMSPAVRHIGVAIAYHPPYWSGVQILAD